jgi:hypothetical protein
MSVNTKLVREFLKSQEDSTDFGGVCEYDHMTALSYIEEMADELDKRVAAITCKRCGPGQEFCDRHDPNN